MLFFQNTNVDACEFIIGILPIVSIAIATCIMIIHNYLIKSWKNNDLKLTSDIALKRLNACIVMKITWIIFVIISVLSVIDFVILESDLIEAKSKGMTINLDTGLRDLSWGQMREYNKRSMKETKITPKDFDSLYGKIVIMYRYDCSDCLALYDDLKSLENVVYLSSRSEIGFAFRDYFNPNLLKVPSGIYIRKDGKPVTLELYRYNDDAESVMFGYDNWNRLLNIQEQDLALE